MPKIHKTYPIDQSPFFKLRSKKRLASILGITTRELRGIANNTDKLYHEFDVPKKSGGMRHVENPCRKLKIIQARIARLLSRIAPPDYLFCPVKGRCYVANAAQHLGQRVIHCLDIKKYFPNTSSRRVFWFFRSIMRCENDVAAILTRLASFRGHLATGSPLSPIMAFFSYVDMWETISAHCSMHGYHLTVYIDDVTISGPSVSGDVLWTIKRAIHASGLRYHKEKCFIDHPAEITGVIVDADRLLPPNRQLKKLTEARRGLHTSGSENDKRKLQARISGLDGQVKQIARASPR